jgi:hypothetical protein
LTSVFTDTSWIFMVLEVKPAQSGITLRIDARFRHSDCGMRVNSGLILSPDILVQVTKTDEAACIQLTGCRV